MRAAVFHGDGVLSVDDVAPPEVGTPDGVVIEVAANAICGTDLHALEVPATVWFRPGVTIGHEFAGVVREAGPQAGFAAGDRVAVLPNITDGTCSYCRSGLPNLCVSMQGFGSDRVQGGAAELVWAPASVVHRVPDELGLEVAAIAEPVACALNGTTRALWQPGDHAVVLGGGPIGAIYHLLARAAGVTTTVVETAAHRRGLVEKLGATTVDPADTAALDALAAEGPVVVVDTVGTLVDLAVRLVRPRGQVLVFGLNDRVQPTLHASDLVRKEVRVEGVFLARETFPRALELLARPELRFAELVTHRFALEEIAGAVEVLRRGDGMKILVQP